MEAFMSKNHILFSFLMLSSLAAYGADNKSNEGEGNKRKRSQQGENIENLFKPDKRTRTTENNDPQTVNYDFFSKKARTEAAITLNQYPQLGNSQKEMQNIERKCKQSIKHIKKLGPTRYKGSIVPLKNRYKDWQHRTHPKID